MRVSSPGLALDEDELERGLGDGEVGVAVAEFGGLGAEELAVEGDGRVEVGDAEGELYAGHGEPPAVWVGGCQQPPELLAGAPTPIWRVAGAAQQPPPSALLGGCRARRRGPRRRRLRSPGG